MFKKLKKLFSDSTPPEKKNKIRVYNCWITVLLPAYEGKVIAKLVKKGYTVGTDLAKNDVNQNNQVSHLIILTLYKTGSSSLTAHQVCADIIQCINELKLFYYSVVASAVEDAAWTGSNMVITQTKSLPSPTPPPSDKSKLN